MSFKNFVESNKDLLIEKLITFGGKAYPKFGNVVILAGGSGSGKGFQIKNILGIEGKIIDVDRLKELALKSPLMQTKYPELKSIDLKNPTDTFKIHDIVNKKEKLNVKMMGALKKSISSSTSQLPNLIFDTTLSEMAKLQEISELVLELGYKKENIHLVWVLADIETARKQNLSRSRTVPDHILFQAHSGTAMTLSGLLKNSEVTRKYLDGDIWISFNVEGTDTGMEIKDRKGSGGFGNWVKGGSSSQGNFVKKAEYIKVKNQGKSLESAKVLTQEILQKIKSYVPNGEF